MYFVCVLLCVIAFSTTAIDVNTKLLRNLPTDILHDLLSIYINGKVYLRTGCSGYSDSAPETDYWVYTQDANQNPSVVTEPNLNITSDRSKIIFLAHGWNRDPNAVNIEIIKDAYLKRYDTFVISVNWGVYSHQTYERAYCTVPKIASNVANFICQIKQKLNISLDTIHAVGHSMGAQIFGIAGRLVYERCGEKIGRITGLDPAGPIYDEDNVAHRLDPSDALFVDVIHTTVRQAGYFLGCGHVDFYPNCGYYQPGCKMLVLKRDALENVTALLDIPEDVVTCSHERSCDYFRESIASNKFIGKECVNCGQQRCFPNFFSFERKIMGEDCTTPGKARNYVFPTHRTSPFAEG